jgi:hypothetical protein
MNGSFKAIAEIKKDAATHKKTTSRKSKLAK